MLLCSGCFGIATKSLWGLLFTAWFNGLKYRILNLAISTPLSNSAISLPSWQYIYIYIYSLCFLSTSFPKHVVYGQVDYFAWSSRTSKWCKDLESQKIVLSGILVKRGKGIREVWLSGLAIVSLPEIGEDPYFYGQLIGLLVWGLGNRCEVSALIAEFTSSWWISLGNFGPPSH